MTQPFHSYRSKRNESIWPHKDPYVKVYISIFVIAKKYKQPKRASTDEWLSKMRYIKAMKHYPAIKRNEELIHAPDMNESCNHYAQWKKPITKNHILYDFIYMKCLEQANLSEIESIWVATCGLRGWREVESDSRWIQAFFRRQWKCPKIDYGHSCTTLWVY